jgi:adenosine deaminase
MAETPLGVARLRRLGEIEPTPPGSYDRAEHFVAWVEDALEEAAADGAVLVEMRFGKEEVLRPGFMTLFREAERRVQARHPALRVEAIIILMPWQTPELLERLLDTCVSMAREGLSGIDLLYQPYDAEVDWKPMYRAAERAADAGLGVTAHAGEFSTANIAAALRTPHLSRIGHAVYAARDPRLLDLLAGSGVTVECSLSCNVVLGAVPSYEEHPLHQFVEHGIPVALCADVPVQIATTIGREYALAHALGFSLAELVSFTTNAIHASFTPPARKAALLAALDWRADGDVSG